MAYDEDVHELAIRFPEALLALAGVRARGPYRVEAAEVKARRRLDLVLSPEAPEQPRIYLEWQGWRDPEIERRMLEEVVMHCVQTGTFTGVRGVIVYTQRELRDAALAADIGDPSADDEDDRLLVRFRPKRVVLTDMDPEELLSAGGGALVALPLVGSEERLLADAARWLDTIRARAPSEREQRDATDLFVRLLAWRLGSMDIAKELLAGEEDVVRETATGQALLAEGRAEGRAEERRRTILLVLELRLGALPAWVAHRLQAESNLERLEALLLGARDVAAVTELEALFGARP